MRVAVVGAGISGLSCARDLSDSGCAVTLFDKGKRPGGRLSTLELDSGSWDFGAPCFWGAGADFNRQVRDWQAAGVVGRWPDGPDNSLVGVPSMAALVEHECARHPVHFQHRVDRLIQREGAWQLVGAGFAEGPFDSVVLAIPAEQAAPLLSLHDLAMARVAATVRSQPCWTTMASFEKPLPGASFLESDGPVARAIRNSSKPGREGRDSWVLHAAPDWSMAHLEADATWVASTMLEALVAMLGVEPTSPIFLKAHRWRFAEAHEQGRVPLWNAHLRLGACGDWCGSPRVAGAWQAGLDLARTMTASFRHEGADVSMDAAE